MNELQLRMKSFFNEKVLHTNLSENTVFQNALDQMIVDENTDIESYANIIDNLS